MKKINLLAALITLLFSNLVFAQWSAEVRHTNNTGFSYTSQNNAKNVVFSSPSNVHTVWYDERFGDTEILYKRSTDGGTAWEPVVRLTNSAGMSNYPSIAVFGSNIHIVWQDNRDGNLEIYYKNSTNHGVTWSADERVTNNSAISNNPAICLYLNKVMIIWQDERDGNFEIYFKRSIDNGITWEPVVRLTNNTSVSQYPSITNDSGENTHIAWQDNRDGNEEIYYKNSTNSGATWGADFRLTNDGASSRKPCIQRHYPGGLGGLHVVWEDDRDGNFEIYHKRSTNSGAAWDPVQRLTNSSGNSYAPTLAASFENLHLVWEDSRSGVYAVYYNRSTNSGVSWGSDLKLNIGTAEARYPNVNFTGNNLFVLWSDLRNADYEVYYRINPTGNPTGITNIGNEIPSYYSLTQNYPNPFNPVTNINFSIPKTGIVKLTIYDASGREAAVLFKGELSAGTYNYDFDASQLASGIYFYKLESGDFTQTKKMVLIK